MDWSTNDIPMFPNADMVKKNENHTELMSLCNAGVERSGFHFDMDMYGAMIVNPINSRPNQYCEHR